jgi:FtsH-binding integral membrane protein
MYFGCNVSFASLPLFVPTIIAEIGAFSRLQANGLSAPPYLLTFILIITTVFVSDRMRMRGPFVVVFGIVSGIGFLLLATTEAAAPRYLGVYFAITTFVCVALLIPWCSNTHATESKRAGGWAIFAIMGQCGPVLGTNLFPAAEGPYYRKGSWVSFACCLLVAVCAAVFSFLLWRENRKLRRMYEDESSMTERDQRRAPRGFEYII